MLSSGRACRRLRERRRKCTEEGTTTACVANVLCYCDEKAANACMPNVHFLLV